MNKISLKSIIGIIVGVIVIFFLMKVMIAIIPVILVFGIVIWLLNKFKKKETKDSKNSSEFYNESFKVKSENNDSNYIDVDYEEIDK